MLSTAFSVIPILYSFHSEMFPTHALTEPAVLVGGVGGSSLAALSAGFIGSRWWFIASPASVVDVVVFWGFSP